VSNVCRDGTSSLGQATQCHGEVTLLTVAKRIVNTTRVVRSVLQNAWGVAFTPSGSPFWVNDNATGCSTLYGGDGSIVPLQVAIPLPGNIIPSSACHTIDAKNPPKGGGPSTTYLRRR
jgi:hypothetical protein